MFIITDKIIEEHSIIMFGSSCKDIENNCILLNNNYGFDIIFPKENVYVYEFLDSLPENVRENKYCYN